MAKSAKQIQDEITNKIIESLNQGNIPWRKPWRSSPNCGSPTNFVSGNSYRGINPLLLSIHQEKNGFSSKWYGTFKQWQDIGAKVMHRPKHIKPGDFGCSIVYYARYTKTKTDPNTGEEIEDQFSVLKNYSVFNAQQVELPAKYKHLADTGLPTSNIEFIDFAPNCFVWYRDEELADPENIMIHYTKHRDSGLLDQSNSEFINNALKQFTEGEDPDVVMESHHHWAVGHIDGFSMRVFRDNQITEAFRTFHKIMESMAIYPILDENDYSNRETEATYENLDHMAWKLKEQFNLPEDWQWQTYDWLSENRESCLENTSDQGGYPEEDDLEAAFEALGYTRAA